LLINMAIRVDFAKDRGPGSPNGQGHQGGRGGKSGVAELDPNSTRSLLLEAPGGAEQCGASILAKFGQLPGFTSSFPPPGSKAARAFVDFKTAKDATAAKSALSGSLAAGYSMAYSKGRPSKKMWVGSVPANFSEAQLAAAFRRFGEVSDRLALFYL